MAGKVMAKDGGRPVRLLRWCGMALMAAGALMVVATLLHPSRETATTIVASEPRLVAAHAVTRSPGCWCYSDFPGSMRRNAAAWTAGIGGLLDCFHGALI
jgi:hypothetical protein